MMIQEEVTGGRLYRVLLLLSAFLMINAQGWIMTTGCGGIPDRRMLNVPPLTSSRHHPSSRPAKRTWTTNASSCNQVVIHASRRDEEGDSGPVRVRVEDVHHAQHENDDQQHPPQVLEDTSDHASTLQRPDRNRMVVSSEIILPFSAEIAFDAFADLPRQPSWSPWLHSVEYVPSPQDEMHPSDHSSHQGTYPSKDTPTTSQRRPLTLWKMRYLGITVSWKAISTQLERPNLIAWHSVQGIPNAGQVIFTPLTTTSSSAETRTHMKLDMTFVLPRVLALFLGRERTATLAQRMEERVLQPTLDNFRKICLQHDVVQLREQQPSPQKQL